ncbi:MAG: VOC family protein [Bradymonadales bacterium]|nr:VOC family protein [Bradymonadales bacterium]
MRLHSITVLQNPDKIELVPHFYDQILRLPAHAEIAQDYNRWFNQPVYLATRPADSKNSGESWGGFTGIQLNLVPPSDLNPIVAVLRATGIRQPEPREVGDVRLLNVFDPSGNSLILSGTEQPPDEPLIDEAVGSVTIFVADIQRTRAFFVDGLGMPVRAEPHPGLLVLGFAEGTSLLLYQVAENLPHCPIGRNTGLAFADEDPGRVLEKAAQVGGSVVDRQPLDANGLVPAGLFTDPDGNQFTILSEKHLARAEDLDE